MRIATSVIRYFFGAWMFVNGLNYYVYIFALPPLKPAAEAFLAQLISTGLYDVAKIIEMIAGALLLTNRFVPAAIAMCLPVSAVILLNNVMLEGGAVGFIAGPATMLLNLFLAYAYSEYFMPLLSMRARVSGAAGLLSWRADWRPAVRPE